jgi:hypothetical protein
MVRRMPYCAEQQMHTEEKSALSEGSELHVAIWVAHGKELRVHVGNSVRDASIVFMRGQSCVLHTTNGVLHEEHPVVYWKICAMHG